MSQGGFDGHRWHDDEIHAVELRVEDPSAVGCEQTLRGEARLVEQPRLERADVGCA